MIHGIGTEYSRTTMIKLDGSMSSTNNGTTDLIGVSRNLYHNEVIPPFRFRNLERRVGYLILETILSTPQ